MFANLLVLLMFVGLVILFGWLCYRAIRAKKLWVKIVGGIGAGLMTLLLLFVAFNGAKGIAATFFPGADPAPQITVAGTPEQIARGEYLVNVSCIGCHSAVDGNGFPTGQHPLTGGFNLPEAEGFGFVGDMTSENLTPGGKLAGYSDGELFRALRHSVSQEGHKLGMMSFLPYTQLSDQDTEAIIAYLRSLPAAEYSGRTGDNLNFIGGVMLGAGMFGPAAQRGADSIAAPPEGATAEYGKYVATFGECRGCHGPDLTGSAATAISAAIPNPRPYVGALTQEQFSEMMRTGIKPGGVPFPETMPWQNAAAMTDSDLAALYTYLTAPVQ